MVALADVLPLGPRDPRVLGPYRLTGLLGKGGMSSVYLARRIAPGADPDATQRPGRGRSDEGPPVALKVIDEDIAQVPAFRARFRREAAAARAVARFCTAEVLDVDVSGPRPYLVTEFIDGPTLGAAVERGPLPPAELERLAVAVASALTAIHAAGVIHRDLKPGNIMLSPSGWRVIDFGLCRPLDDVTNITVGRLGTPVFMAPEQALDRRATTATDVHAWGAIMVYAATGHPPFGEPPLLELLHRVIHDAPDVSALPAALAPVVAEALAKHPAHRPSARDLLLRLTDAALAPRTPDSEDTLRLPKGPASLLPVPPQAPRPGGGRPGQAPPRPDGGPAPQGLEHPPPERQVSPTLAAATAAAAKARAWARTMAERHRPRG